MRKREIQSITLKLSELKEYDLAKQERAAVKGQKLNDAPTTSGQESIAKIGPKTKQEIRERIGFTE